MVLAWFLARPAISRVVLYVLWCGALFVQVLAAKTVIGHVTHVKEETAIWRSVMVALDVRRRERLVSRDKYCLFKFRLSSWSVGLISLYMIIAIVLYFWEQTSSSLFFLASALSFATAYFLGAVIEQFNFRNRIVLSFSFLFMLLWFLNNVYSWYLYAIERAASPIPYVIMPMFFWLPVCLLFIYSLLRTYLRIRVSS